MGLTEILNEKKRQTESIKNKFKLLKKNKILWIDVMDIKEIISDLLKKDNSEIIKSGVL